MTPGHMEPRLRELIRDPATGAAVELKTEPDERACPREFLFNPETSQRFPIREGIPVFLGGEVSGSNKRYDQAFDVVFHSGGINFFNHKAAAMREMIRVAKPGTKFATVDENEALARKYERFPVTGAFHGHRKDLSSAPVDLLPPEMQEVQAKNIAGGDLYCLSFRKPG
jgi:uncharacterized protein YbaR (Trm112 family)